MIIKCKRCGFINPTEVEVNNKILVTQGLSIEELSKLWKWYYNIPPYEPIYLAMPTKLYNSVHQLNLFLFGGNCLTSDKSLKVGNLQDSVLLFIDKSEFLVEFQSHPNGVNRNNIPCKNVAELFAEQGIKVVEENF